MQHYKILCIDDNDNNLFTLESLLCSLKNVDVLLASSGSKGLEMLLSVNIDLILLDVQMPEMNGFDVASFVKKNKKTAHIPIIFISAVFTTKEFIKRGYRSGAIDYLAKPIDDNQLLNKISFYLQLLQKEKELQSERNRLQNIIDMQDNVVMVVDKHSILQVNRSFLDLVGFKTLSGFLKKYNCICDLFVKEEGYLQGDKEKTWLDTVMKEEEKNSIAIIPFHNMNRYFTVQVNVLDLEPEQFVATFTDITHIQLESMEFERESIYDPLTNIYNRRKFDMELKRLYYISKKYRFNLGILMIDIDKFKVINDTFGHQKGDDVLIELTQRLSPLFREGDLFARYGGEEFVVVLAKSSLSQALTKAHHLNKVIAEHPFEGVGEITISIGVATLQDGDAIETMINRADKGLYLAKNNGRNRVETVEE